MTVAQCNLNVGLLSSVIDQKISVGTFILVPKAFF